MEAANNKKLDYKDMISVALLHIANLGEPERVFESVLEGGVDGLEMLSKYSKRDIKNVPEDEIIYELLKIVAFANTANIVLLNSLKSAIKDPVLRSFMFFAATNLTATMLVKKGAVSQAEIEGLSDLIALLSPQTVSGLLGDVRAAKEAPDAAERDLMDKSLPEGFMEDLQKHFDAKKHREMVDKMGHLFSKLK